MRVSDDKIFMLCQIHVVLYYMETKEELHAALFNNNL